MSESLLPADSHVHSEWSWDAPNGSMETTCARAVELGLPSVAFTEHADFTPWATDSPEGLPPHVVAATDGAGTVLPPQLDLDGYLECLDRCRDLFPSLRIYAGVELSEPHWHDAATRELLGRTSFERILASMHSTRIGDGSRFAEVGASYASRPAHQVVRDYLGETRRMVEGFDGFEILAHIDYPVRYWPRLASVYDVRDFEEDYRGVLSALAAAGKVLEVNTRVPLDLQILLWWREAGGDAITFASDAHRPEALADGFRDATQMATAAGFRPSRDPHSFWSRG